MKRDNIFWGTLLIILGVLLYLQTQGIVVDIFRYFWPLVLILVGGWIILNVFWRPAGLETFSVPLGAAKRARIKLEHGAGQVEISGGAPAGQAIVGSVAGGMKRESRVEGDQLEVRLEAGPSFLLFGGPPHGIWQFQLTQEVPLSLVVESGASSLNLDLKDVPATHIELKTGASNSNVVMPARGVSVLDVEAGAASVNVRVPDATAARIRTKQGLSSISVDTNRFPRLEAGLYQSPNFDSSTDRAEINIESGLVSVSVR